MLNTIRKLEHEFIDSDNTGIKLSFVYSDAEQEPILGIDTSEGEVVSISASKETLDILIKQLVSMRISIYGEGQ